MNDEKDAANSPEENPLAPLADAPAKETVDRIKDAVKKTADKKDGK